MVQPRSALEEVGQQLSDDAAAHRRIARQNRDLASKKLKQLDDLRAFCKANGIPFKVEPRKEQA